MIAYRVVNRYLLIFFCIQDKIKNNSLIFESRYLFSLRRTFEVQGTFILFGELVVKKTLNIFRMRLALVLL
ncbi:hypothetical protein SK128_001623 [Halocaridina rubra]|uniref:Uncharacterized protein n=1 Tax=Halocaridina rubra TaxID=373956 RepID=A0AAN9A5K0_HALRR